MSEPSDTAGSSCPPLPRRTEDSLATRASLVRRLADPDDHEGWKEFHDRYARLVLNVARKAGLSDTEADEAVQEWLLSVARKMPEFRYEPGRDSFKGWLLHLARFRIADQFRRRSRPSSDTESHRPPWAVPPETETATPPELEALWNAEWNQALLEDAVQRTRARARPEHYEIFHLSVLRHQSPRDVARTLGVPLPRVYLAKHRVGRLLAAAIREVRAEWDSG